MIMVQYEEPVLSNKFLGSRIKNQVTSARQCLLSYMKIFLAHKTNDLNFSSMHIFVSRLVHRIAMCNILPCSSPTPPSGTKLLPHYAMITVGNINIVLILKKKWRALH